MSKADVKRAIKIEAARRNFYQYCRTLYPDFYKKDRKYLKYLCDTLEDFINDPNKKTLFLSMPPQMGKSFSVCNLENYLLGKNPRWRIITASFNETVSTKISKNVRNVMQAEKADEEAIIYSDIFNTTIKKGSSAAKMWQTTQSNIVNYLATSPSGTVTSFGAELMIIDDIVKDAYVALNEKALDDIWDWFVDTMLSRLVGPRKLIMIGTRWSKRDLIGRWKRELDEIGEEYVEIKLKAYDEATDTMLCEELFPRAEYERKKRVQSEEIFQANYNQEPIDLKNALYTRPFKLYTTEELEKISTKGTIISYTDTADEGDDYLASFIALAYDRKLYVLDIIYTKASMEVTEPLLASKIHEHQSTFNEIESNNGGRGFARNVKRILEQELNNYYCTIHWFFQKKRKMSRINVNSARVQETVYFPVDWATKWKQAAEDILTFKTIGNKNDDIADSLTGLVELAQYKGLID